MLELKLRLRRQNDKRVYYALRCRTNNGWSKRDEARAVLKKNNLDLIISSSSFLLITNTFPPQPTTFSLLFSPPNLLSFNISLIESCLVVLFVPLNTVSFFFSPLLPSCKWD